MWYIESRFFYTEHSRVPQDICSKHAPIFDRAIATAVLIYPCFSPRLSLPNVRGARVYCLLTAHSWPCRL